jgi:hypothetical protein
MIGAGNRIVVRIVIAPAVGDDAVVGLEHEDLWLPGAIVALAAVQHDHRLALARFNVVQLYPVDDHPRRRLRARGGPAHSRIVAGRSLRGSVAMAQSSAISH